jgi:hypothetical protein
MERVEYRIKRDIWEQILERQKVWTNMQICLVAYIPREGYGLDHWRFNSRSWEKKIFLLSSPRE